MIVAERKPKVTIIKTDCFGEQMPGGRTFCLREVIFQSKKLGRTLTEEEMKRFQV